MYDERVIIYPGTSLHYPLFVVIFAWVFYRQMYVTASVLVGGAFILIGAGLIITITNNMR